MDLDAHRSGAMVVDEIKSEIQEINFIGNAAVVIVIYETKGKMLGQPMDGKYKYIRIWNQVNNIWKVIGGSCIRISVN